MGLAIFFTLIFITFALYLEQRNLIIDYIYGKSKYYKRHEKKLNFFIKAYLLNHKSYKKKVNILLLMLNAILFSVNFSLILAGIFTIIFGIDSYTLQRITVFNIMIDFGILAIDLFITTELGPDKTLQRKKFK